MEKTTCPNCKEEIEPIVQQGTTYMLVPGKCDPIPTTLLGCPRCKIIFFKSDYIDFR
ncbi:MAG: hypothetical protein ACFFDF_00970 [Candidatus Odinarchaeota archaeon]